MLERWLEQMRQISIEVGLDPEEAMRMTVRDFMRTVATRAISRQEKSEWLTKVLGHCESARNASLATMHALGKSSGKVRKAVAS